MTSWVVYLRSSPLIVWAELLKNLKLLNYLLYCTMKHSIEQTLFFIWCISIRKTHFKWDLFTSLHRNILICKKQMWILLSINMVCPGLHQKVWQLVNLGLFINRQKRLYFLIGLINCFQKVKIYLCFSKVWKKKNLKFWDLTMSNTLL